MATRLENRVSKFLHCDVRCQLLLHGEQVINMFDTVIQDIGMVDDGGILVTYNGGAIHISNGEIVDHPALLIIKGRDANWSLVVIRLEDLPSDVGRFPTSSRQ